MIGGGGGGGKAALGFWPDRTGTLVSMAIYLKFKQTRRPKLKVFYRNDANGIANSEDPDQTAPLGAV